MTFLSANSGAKLSAFHLRLEDCRTRAGFSYADMARWLGVPWATIYSWGKGGRMPKHYQVPLVEEKLAWLEEELGKGLNLPLPLGTRQSDRRAIVEALVRPYHERSVRARAAS